MIMAPNTASGAAAGAPSASAAEQHDGHFVSGVADAQATAYVQIRDPGEATLYGVGIDGNIVTASLKAVASAATRVSHHTRGQ